MSLVVLHPEFQQNEQSHGAEGFKLRGTIEIGLRRAPQTLDRTLTRLGKRLQRGPHRLVVVITLHGQPGTIDVRKSRMRLSKDALETRLVGVHVDVAKVEHILTERKEVVRRLTRELALTNAGEP